MTVNNINDDISNVYNYDGMWISEFIRLLDPISSFLCSIDSDNYHQMVHNLRTQMICGDSEEDDRSEIDSAISNIRSVIARR